MASEEEHHVLVDRGASAVAALGPHAVAVGAQVQLRPGVRQEVESVEIVSVVTVVAPEDVHRVLVDHCRVGVPRRWNQP